MTSQRRPPGVLVIRHRLIKARLEQGMTQQALASAMGGMQSSVSEWENGSRVPRLDSAIRWARALGLELTLRPEAK